jgi:hypothetical protein
MLSKRKGERGAPLGKQRTKQPQFRFIALSIEFQSYILKVNMRTYMSKLEEVKKMLKCRN